VGDSGRTAVVAGPGAKAVPKSSGAP